MEEKYIFGLVLISIFFSSINLYPHNHNDIQSECPRLYQKNYRGFVPRGNLSAGLFEEILGIDKLKACVIKCCKKEKCNVAFISLKKCYHIACSSNELCVPTLSTNSNARDEISMVLVKPTDDDTWENVLQMQELINEQANEPLDRDIYNVVSENKLRDAWKDLNMDESYMQEVTACTVGSDEACMPNEICVPNYLKSRAGTCQCKDTYFENQEGECVPVIGHSGIQPLPEILTDRILEMTSGAPNNSLPVTRQHLTVTAESKEVRLPKNEVTLIAEVSPQEGDIKYQYEWTSLHQPSGSTAVKHQNEGQLHLENLSEGLYTFKVSVSTPTAYGENFVNVTVLPASRINKPPQIVITPANQTIKQPNAAAVLDASSSTDDDQIVSWHWELQQGPLGYQPQLTDTPTLQLNDLTKPGNYSFKLTVTDSDKATSSSIANITVLKLLDYPPEANAGEDKIIYLPHNAITLNGNLSTDDHAITTWEWTKSADDAQKAVDMQDTRTPYLQLSNLEEGMYTFSLRVTDSANQSSTAQVHVFVKPPTNKPPVANGGQNLTISLPQTWIILDASNSTDDNKIVGYKWEQLEGPSTVTFENYTLMKTNVTGLTKGMYRFKLTVTDDNKNVASDVVYVLVNQNKNQKPTAIAPKQITVELPCNVVNINGSDSKDDWAIVKWKWTRDDNSLAIGNIAEKSDELPILQLTDVAVGKYIFNLTVADEQGLTDTTSVTVTVKSDPRLIYLIEITVNIEARYLTEAQYNTLKGKLALLVADGTKLQVRNVRPAVGTGKAMITFFVETTDGIPVAANEVVQHLRQKLRVDASLLGFSVARLQTAICQNNCSGHGVCNEQTRKCICEAFWMQDMFKVYLNMDDDSDCSWSILYVVIGVIGSFLLLLGSMWGIGYLCYSWCAKRKTSVKPPSYKLIEDTDDLPPYASRKSALSDSDTDSDVVFESRSKPPRYADSRNGHKPSRNGFTKLNSRRVKT